MKSINKVALSVLMVLVFITAGNSSATNSGKTDELVEYQMSSSLDIQESSHSSRKVDCTLTFKNDDGTSLEVTFHDVTRFQCVKMKVGKWIKETF